MRTATRLFTTLQSNLQKNPILETPNRFEIEINPEYFAKVTYRKEQDDVYNLLHSEIPKEFKRQGLGRILALRIFEELALKNRRFKITCEFLQKVYRENQQKYQRFVIADGLEDNFTSGDGSSQGSHL